AAAALPPRRPSSRRRRSRRGGGRCAGPRANSRRARARRGRARRRRSRCRTRRARREGRRSRRLALRREEATLRVARRRALPFAHLARPPRPVAGGVDRPVPAPEHPLHGLPRGVVLAGAVPVSRSRRLTVATRPELERVEDRLVRPDEAAAAGPGSHLAACLYVVHWGTGSVLSLEGESASV